MHNANTYEAICLGLAHRMLIVYIVARESPKPMQGEDDDDELNQIRSDRDEQAKCERISQLHDGYRHNARIARGLGALSRRNDPRAVHGPGKIAGQRIPFVG